jgi:hypothetical protein
MIKDLKLRNKLRRSHENTPKGTLQEKITDFREVCRHFQAHV